MQRLCLLNTNTVGALSYSESLSGAPALSLKDSTLKNLDSFTVTLFDSCVHSYGIPYAKLGCFCFELFRTQCF